MNSRGGGLDGKERTCRGVLAGAGKRSSGLSKRMKSWLFARAANVVAKGGERRSEVK